MSISSPALTSCPAAGRAPRRRRSLMARLVVLFSLRKQRRELVGLTAERLRDLGITPEQARREAARPLWDVPPGWRS